MTNGTDTRFDALQIELRRRLSRGLLVQGSYQFGKALSTAYASGDEFVFMNGATFDQETLTAEMVGDASKYLTEESTVQLLKFNGRVISLEMPNSVFLNVTEAGEGAKGDTANAALKPAIVETGAELMVPMFVKQGDVIKVHCGQLNAAR